MIVVSNQGINMKITNTTGVSLSLAVWAASDEYDHDDDPSVISTTGLLKPLRAIALGVLVPTVKSALDVTDLLALSMGTALHNDIENAWKNHYKASMKKLGYSEKVIDRIVINPETPPTSEQIPIYLERRTKKTLGKYVISGKFDKVMEGKLHDYKSTSAWSWIFGGNEEDYILQMSIYRWLNPDIVTQDVFNIEYIFTDWSSAKARQDSSYPQQRVASKTYNLMSLTETEAWLVERLDLIEKYINTPIQNLPLCTAKELWQKDPAYKYYKDPLKKTRSTKNFDNMADAIARRAKDGNVGEIVIVPGEVKRCAYCSVRPACTQAEDLAASGALKL